MTRNSEQYEVQRQKRKTDHHVIGNGWQYATENVKVQMKNAGRWQCITTQ